MMLARVCRATLSPNVNSLMKTPIVSKSFAPKGQTVRLFASDGRSSFTRTARRRMTAVEQAMAPAGESAYSAGKGARAGFSAPQSPPTQQDPQISSRLLCFWGYIGFLMLFSFLSAFFWLNVMCFDIWWKFGSLRHSGKTMTKRRDDFRRFISYCIYAWGLAFGFVIITVIADNVEILPNKFRPDIGNHRCWFSTLPDEYGEIIFFTGPVSVQLIVNLTFFILTARRCSIVKAEINRRVLVNRTDSRSRRFEADKAKLILNVKLFIVMGVSWALEVISYFLSNYYPSNLEWKERFFYVSDGVNCLQGVLIFVLFVLKKKVLDALRRRFSKGNSRRASTGGILDPYRVRKSPSSSTILSTFAVSTSP